MTAVFVHGLPETARIWDPLREVLGGDSIAVELPGFGVPRPAGFSATKDAYATWLADELGRVDGPIDLVGHDIGALLVLRVVTAFDVAARSSARGRRAWASSTTAGWRRLPMSWRRSCAASGRPDHAGSAPEVGALDALAGCLSWYVRRKCPTLGCA